MCSIFGYYKIGGSKVNENFICYAFDLMRHRGPDNEKFIDIDTNAGFGHQRLAIIDVLKEANQPMKNGDSYIVFNGEIYNYTELKEELKKTGITFKTASDTEVLLKGVESAGVQFLNKCNGMFAFGFYDKKKEELILARDRFGVKPLHYMVEDDVLYFSSEIKPLIKIKSNIIKNMRIYDAFVRDVATDFDEDTFIKDIYQLKKGCILTCGRQGVKIKKWYNGNDFDFDEELFKDENKTIEFTEQLLADAINKRLRSDVPVCITLSGGLDSTVIYTLIKENLKKDIQPFTFRHPGSNTDEYEKVSELVRPYGGKVRCVQSDYERGYEQIEDVLRYLEFPVWSFSAIAYMDMYKAIRSQGFIVVLEGHSSDEQLGGYPVLVRSAVFEYIAALKFSKAVSIYKVLSETNNPDIGEKNSPVRFFGSFVKNIFLNKKLDISFDKAVSNIFDYKILPIVLRAFDRLTMKSSVESRSPFMDYRLVEFFKKMPLRYKVSESGSKAILREILKKHNKDFIYKDKRKMGFACDLPAFFKVDRNKERIREWITCFDMENYAALKEKALSDISKKYIGWQDADVIWKTASLSIVNNMYGV